MVSNLLVCCNHVSNKEYSYPKGLLLTIQVLPLLLYVHVGAVALFDLHHKYMNISQNDHCIRNCVRKLHKYVYKLETKRC